VAGVVAGAAVALPLGAIGVLLVQEAISAGWRTAAAGALGVALVDLSYAAVAVLAGTSVSQALAGHEAIVRLTGAGLLTAVAVKGLYGVFLPRVGGKALTERVSEPASALTQPSLSTQPPLPTTQPSVPTTQPALSTQPHRPLPSARRALIRFVTLTAVNPLTAIYFVALAAGSGDAVHGAERATAFLAGVFGASLSWQLLLVLVGSLAGARLGARARAVTGLLGHLVVLGYAVRMATGAG